ncbi:hypothetical protein [Polynucleobacter necessarius]|uniref:hypothetical protein n=1 Tax=Polynucleobacter necessarius TaxID=576610 RepID=UPI000E0932F6|nr:hypothetical protein [Polynucleobacter necessarius]
MSDKKTVSQRRDRDFIKKLLTIGGGVSGILATKTALSQANDGNFLAIDPWTKIQGSTFISPPYGLPSKYEKDAVRVLPSPPPTFLTGSRTPPVQNLHWIITPNGLVFERHHAGMPDINPNQHRLVMHGLVDRPMIFSMEDIV